MFHFLPTWHQWYRRPRWPHWLKNRGCNVPWFQQKVWEVLVSLIQGYPHSVTQAVASVIPFAIAYLCESHFPALSATKVKRQGHWDITRDLLSCQTIPKISYFYSSQKNSGLFFGMFFWAELMSLFWFIFTIWIYYLHFFLKEVINFCIKIQECERHNSL